MKSKSDKKAKKGNLVKNKKKVMPKEWHIHLTERFDRKVAEETPARVKSSGKLGFAQNTALQGVTVGHLAGDVVIMGHHDGGQPPGAIQ